MFKSAILKLTGLYLLILMAVSLFFSFNLYHTSSSEVDNRLRRQVDFFNTRPLPGQVFDLSPFEQQRQVELSNSNHAVLDDLIYINLAVLLFGGLGSYLLAKRTLRPIEEAHAAQARFTADASHELRTPIAAMRSETEVGLRDPKLTIKEARELLASNVEELQNLSNLSEGLLELARNTNSDTRMDENVSIKDIAKAATEQISKKAKAKHVKVRSEALTDTTVTGNKIQLIQLLVILMDNAIKYSPDKESVVLSSRIENGEIYLSVSDRGKGMTPEELSHVFERFYRADGARSKDGAGGYGLGLSIAEQIVRIHHGSIEATSTVGAGSTFTIVLPIATELK